MKTWSCIWFKHSQSRSNSSGGGGSLEYAVRKTEVSCEGSHAEGEAGSTGEKRLYHLIHHEMWANLRVWNSGADRSRRAVHKRQQLWYFVSEKIQSTGTYWYSEFFRLHSQERTYQSFSIEGSSPPRRSHGAVAGRARAQVRACWK